MRRRIDPIRRPLHRVIALVAVVLATACTGPGTPAPANPPQSDLFAALEAQGETGLVQSYRQGLQAREGVSAISIPTFAFSVNVPADGELRAGYTVADRDWPNATTKSTFSILVRDGDRPVTSLHRGTIGETGESPPDDWIDVVADLSPWAGRRVDIVMQVERAPKTPGAAPLAYREGVPVWSRAVVQSRVAPKVMNVLWITIDTLRPTQVGAYGYAKPTTPEIDAWAQKGIVFTQAIAQSPWTRTSVSSMLYSAYPHQICAKPTCAGGGFVIERPMPNLPGAFRDAGFATVAYVANDILDHSYGTARGFDRFVQARSDEDAAAGTIAWMRAHGGERPFFAYLHFLGPHGPYGFVPGASENFIDEASGRRLEEKYKAAGALFAGVDPADREALIAMYDGKLLATDRLMGRVRRALDDAGLAANTVVVIVSDHGEEFLEHQAWGHGQSLFDEQLRVPLVLLPPGLDAQKRIDEQVALVDVAPTVLGLLGLPIPESFVGRAMLGDLGAPRDAVLAEYLNSGPESAAIRTPNLKYIYEYESGREQVYDLGADPGEHVNLSTQAGRLEQGRFAFQTFNRQLSIDRGRYLVELRLVSSAPVDWSVEANGDRAVIPMLHAAPGDGQGWMASNDYRRVRVSGRTEKGRELAVTLPARGDMTSLSLKILANGRELAPGALIVPTPGEANPASLLANVMEPAAREHLFSLSSPPVPAGEGTHALVWIGAPGVGWKSRNQKELREKLQALGYLN